MFPRSWNYVVKQEPSISDEDIKHVGVNALMAWEKVRAGMKKLLLVYPSKVYELCKEVHVGPSCHKARLCGVFKYESYQNNHDPVS